MDKSFTKGLRVLEALALSTEPRGVAELAREMRMTKSNVHRLLSTLVAAGFARRNVERGSYEPDLKLWRLGSQVAARLDVRKVSAPYLAHLRNATQETAHLAILDGHMMVYIDRVESDQYVRTYGRIGAHAPAHCTGTGKALLSGAPPATIDAALRNLKRYTDRTLTSAPRVLAELNRVRAQGYAVTKGEWRQGVWSIAAPIRDHTGAVVAAVGVSGPADRLRRILNSLCKTATLDAAAAISADLGATGPRSKTNAAA